MAIHGNPWQSMAINRIFPPRNRTDLKAQPSTRFRKAQRHRLCIKTGSAVALAGAGTAQHFSENFAVAIADDVTQEHQTTKFFEKYADSDIKRHESLVVSYKGNSLSIHYLL